MRGRSFTHEHTHHTHTHYKWWSFVNFFIEEMVCNYNLHFTFTPHITLQSYLLLGAIIKAAVLLLRFVLYVQTLVIPTPVVWGMIHGESDSLTWISHLYLLVVFSYYTIIIIIHLLMSNDSNQLLTQKHTNLKNYIASNSLTLYKSICIHLHFL